MLIVGSAPFWLRFQDQHTPTTLCFVLAAMILVASLTTRAEWGLIRVMPHKLHLLADVVVGLFAVLSPFLFGFADHHVARNALIVFGPFGIMAGTLSPSDEMLSRANVS